MRGVYEISVRSMNIDDRPTTDLRGNSHILGKFQMAITLQRIIRFTVCTQTTLCPRSMMLWKFGVGWIRWSADLFWPPVIGRAASRDSQLDRRFNVIYSYGGGRYRYCEEAKLNINIMCWYELHFYSSRATFLT